MKKENRKNIVVSLGILISFVLWTLAVCFIDVKTVGPQNSAVGFARINVAFHNFTGVHMFLYTVTDWLGLVPFVFVMGFAVLGLVQWIKRGKFCKVDFSLLMLGGFYIVTMALYMLFEYVVINYRPVLIAGFLEASYPSSTTMLVLCVMPTSMMQLRNRIKNKALRVVVLALIAFFSVFMVVGRLISGVHWLTDIIGGILLSAGLVTMYYAVGMQK